MTMTTPSLNTPRASTVSHEQMLDRLGEIAVRIGLNVAKGQEVVITASIEALPLVRRVTEHAYKAGASLVTTIFNDDESTLARFRHATDDSFDLSTDWLFEGMAKAMKNGAARLGIVDANPSLLAGQDVGRVSRASQARGKAYKPVGEVIGDFAINWSMLPYASRAWATTVFPNEPEDIAIAKLWRAIFAATRVDGDDPVGAWKAHNEALQNRVNFLNSTRFAALHFVGPGTDLRVGLADEHNWVGGGTRAKNGIFCFPNMPTEEVFTTPHCQRIEGFVSSTKPLSYQGSMIEGIFVRFEAGKIVEARASKGQDVLEKMIGTDEGARRLGEVALVPHSSPISASGIIYFTTLFDENAACHIALGSAYSICVNNGGQMKQDELAAFGSNQSQIHVDWMIGSDKINVFGINAAGESVPLMHLGEWV